MDIKEEFNKINAELLSKKNETINQINDKIEIIENQIKTKLLSENIKYDNQIKVEPIINKFYQKIINMNNFVEENLIFNIKNEPDDIMFLQKNIVSINIESKSVEVKEELQGIFELILYNLTVQNHLDAYLYKKVKEIINVEQNKIIPLINDILNNLLEQNKKTIIKKYNEIMKQKNEENPNKYELNTAFLSNYAKAYLVKVSNEMIILNKKNINKKIDEVMNNLKNSIAESNKAKKMDVSKLMEPLNIYINTFIDTLFNKLNQITTTTSEIIYSNNLKKDLDKYNNYTNKIIDKEIVLDKEFENFRKKLIQNKIVKKELENVKLLDESLYSSKNSIISMIKIEIMDTLKTNSFNINRTITCTNFIKYSTKEQIEELDEKDLTQMFNLLIKNE